MGPGARWARKSGQSEAQWGLASPERGLDLDLPVGTTEGSTVWSGPSAQDSAPLPGGSGATALLFQGVKSCCGPTA